MKQDFDAVVDFSIPYTFNYSDPDFVDLTSRSDHPNAFAFGGDGTQITRYGTFFQDNIDLTNDLVLTAGLRYDKVKYADSEDKDSLVPQVALVYKINVNSSVYANYSESFNPQTSVDINGKTLDPEVGSGYELGFKQNLFDNKFYLTTAVFSIEKENVAILDPAGSFVYMASGKQESKGFEIDLSGEIKEGWSIIASYGYTKTKDKGDNEGKELVGVPKHTANLFTTYNLKDLGFSHTYIGGGVQYLGTRYASDDNSIKVDSALIYNATIGYKEGNWRTSLSVKNLSDKEYIQSVGSSTLHRNIYAGAPRTLYASIAYSF